MVRAPALRSGNPGFKTRSFLKTDILNLSRELKSYLCGSDTKLKEGRPKFTAYEKMNIKLFHFMLKFKRKPNRTINTVFWKISNNEIRSGSCAIS